MPMLLGFMIRQKETPMKCIMDLSLCQKFQAIGSWPDDLDYFEWAISFRLQFNCWMGSL
jgi:hypothetical protein